MNFSRLVGPPVHVQRPACREAGRDDLLKPPKTPRRDGFRAPESYGLLRPLSPGPKTGMLQRQGQREATANSQIQKARLDFFYVRVFLFVLRLLIISLAVAVEVDAAAAAVARSSRRQPKIQFQHPEHRSAKLKTRNLGSGHKHPVSMWEFPNRGQ